MGSDTSTPTGPDLSQGIDANTLADGAALRGHAHGEPVMLVRRGTEWFALGANCTHYGGPLDEGLLVGDTVRCPWHDACFSLRTGEALEAPALNPVACYSVERDGARVRVGARIEPAAPRAIKGPESVVIVGGGGAGNAAAEMLRRRGYEGPVTMISADAAVPCDRPNLSKDYLAGTAPEEWIPLRDEAFYAAHRVDLMLSTRVVAMDTAARTVTLGDGRSLRYGALILATGAAPVRLTVPGADDTRVHYLRTLADSRAIIAAAQNARRAVVIGASFIGMEVAASLRTRGLEVHVVAPDALPLARVLGDALGEMIRAVHVSHGVVFHLGQTVREITADSVVLGDGTRVPADLVVAGVGVRPNTELAERAGITVDRGVIVDAYLETSVKGVFAAGDIARWPDVHAGESTRVEHWVVAERQGQVAARNALGERVKFESVPYFWSNHYDVAIQYAGHATQWDRVDVSGDVAGQDCAVAFRRGGRTLAVATVGRDHVRLEAEMAIARGDEGALARLVPSGK